MIDYYINSNIFVQTFIATLMTFGITALGASLVFFFKRVNKTVLDGMLGLSSGVMIAASFWSLLDPAINGAINLGIKPWIIVSLGFLSGTVFLIISDLIIDKCFIKNRTEKNNKIKRNIMLVMSITLHNIPEGLAIGVAFGSVMNNIPGSTLAGAFMLAVGVGIQNFPEGSAISLPLRRDNYSRSKSFLFGALSGIVEPISGLIGCALVLVVKNILPFFLSFAAGAMIYVVISELIPESQKNKHKKLMAFFTIIGFVIMMILDITLG